MLTILFHFLQVPDCGGLICPFLSRPNLRYRLRHKRGLEIDQGAQKASARILVPSTSDRKLGQGSNVDEIDVKT